jgi:hypothetical protein
LLALAKQSFRHVGADKTGTARQKYLFAIREHWQSPDLFQAFTPL